MGWLYWAQIPKQEVDDWCDNVATFASDNGESLQQLFNRVEEWLTARVLENSAILAVGHAGWINTAKMITNGQ